jgi:hypothetical protein
MSQLRVALVQGGRIVEDRTFSTRGPVSVGSAPDCTFLVPLADVPRRVTVFDSTRKGTTLLFTGDADGRISLGDGETTLKEVTSLATKRGEHFELTLGPKARGRITVGEVSLLFQFVEPMPKPPPAALPKGARGLVAQIDRSFLLVLGLSLAAHFAGVGWISAQPMPVDPESLDEEVQPDRFARAIVPIAKKPKDAESTSAPSSSPSDTQQPVAKRPTTVKPKGDGASMNERVRNAGLIGIIGSRGPGDGSAFGDILDGTGVRDIAAAMKDAGGVRVASVEDATTGQRRGAEQGETTSVDLPGTQGVREVRLEERTGPPPKPEVETEPLQVQDTDIDGDALARWLKSRKSAVQSCYERELKRQPTLAGRMVIRFSVTGRGRIEQVSFGEDTMHSLAVQTCITNVMRGWVLPFAPEESVPVALPFVFSATR